MSPPCPDPPRALRRRMTGRERIMKVHSANKPVADSVDFNLLARQTSGLTGADLDEANQLHFSHAGITAKQKVGETNGLPEANKFLITIATNVALVWAQWNAMRRSSESAQKLMKSGEIQWQICSS